MKRFKIVPLFATALFLAACGNLQNASVGSSTTESGGTAENSYQTTGQISDDSYQGIIQKGKYLTSQSRGVTISKDNNGFNLKSFEAGLLTLSKNQFSTKDYLFREGQLLEKKTAQNWLGRKSKTNAEGLNPEDNGETDPDKRNPIYLQQVLEMDYMKKKDDALLLSGMTIGLALNKTDYYQKEQYGATFETNISTAKMTEEGKTIANTVLARMREKKGAANIPIVIALYEQAPNDSLVGGSIFAYAISDDGGKSVTKWLNVNEENVVFPVVNNAKVPSTQDADDFENFRSQVEGFFPNLSGITAQAHYQDNDLQGMSVTINTQFYSETEIISFTNYLAESATKYLPKSIPVSITVSSTEGIQSFLSKSSNDKVFTSHVFGSY